MYAKFPRLVASLRKKTGKERLTSSGKTRRKRSYKGNGLTKRILQLDHMTRKDAEFLQKNGKMVQELSPCFSLFFTQQLG